MRNCQSKRIQWKLKKSKHIRLRKIIKDDEICDKLLYLYYNLQGKENLKKRLILKTMIWASTNPSNDKSKYHSPIEYFSIPTSAKPWMDVIKLFECHILNKDKETPWLFGHALTEILGNFV